MKTILVSASSGIVGYGILRNLRNHGYKLIGTTIYDLSPANCFADVVEIVPKANDSDYVDALVRIIKKYNVDILAPGHESEMIVWNENREKIKETGAVLLLNNEKLISLCSDKWLFYQEEEKKGLPCRIRTNLGLNIDNLSFPMVVKPRRGYGSQGVRVIRDNEELDEYKKWGNDSYIIQDFVGNNNEEYTVSAFFDSESCLKAMMALKRKLSKGGFTEMAETVRIDEFKDIITQLGSVFKPVGPTNFQFRKVGNIYKLLEINPRISSSTSIRAKFGYNECLMAIDYFLDNKDIVQPKIKKGRAIRYIEEYIWYDSDNI